MQKLKVKKTDNFVQPVYYNEGLAFINKEFILYYKENKIFEEKTPEEFEIMYPTTSEEVNQLSNLIKFLYTRLSNAGLNENEKLFLILLQKIIIQQEKLKNGILANTLQDF